MPFYWFCGLPNCLLDLEHVESLVLERYKAYSSPDSVLEHSLGCTNDGDSIGHLFMCLIAKQNTHISTMIQNGELKLFSERLNIISVEDISKVLSLTLNFLSIHFEEQRQKLKQKGRTKMKIAVNLLATMLERVDHFMKPGHMENCTKSNVILPFTFPLRMVRKRNVELSDGKAKVSCGHWRWLLKDVFEYLLELEMDAVWSCEALQRALCMTEDDRIRQIVSRCAVAMSGKGVTELKLARELDMEVKHFPPCMANLHQILRRTHRLSYDSRYQYTLFLKDVGLPVEESLSFWEEEYRKPQLGSQCQHTWEDKETRYKYQIQHLYGLTGSCVSKSSHGCDKFIDSLQSKMDGGCPFRHCGAERLAASLPRALRNTGAVEEVFRWREAGEPRRACAAYLRCQGTVAGQGPGTSQRSVVTVPEIASPLQFYNLSKNLARRCGDW